MILYKLRVFIGVYGLLFTIHRTNIKYADVIVVDFLLGGSVLFLRCHLLGLHTYLIDI